MENIKLSPHTPAPATVWKLRQGMMKQICIALLLLFSIHPHLSYAQKATPVGDPIVIRVIHLDYADAENLAKVLAPLLSKEGRVVAYRPTNSLIIKDRRSIVKQLIKIIKGNCDP